MLTTIIAYSIFITNPMGTLGPHPQTQSAPYFVYEESQMREYKTQEECDTVASALRSDLAQKADALYRAANTTQKSADYRIQKAKFDSLKCMSVEREINTDYANTVDGNKERVQEQPSVSPAVMYRIGRVDASNRFYGTQYDVSAYGTLSLCENAYTASLRNVAAKAANEGGDADGVATVLSQYKAKYACHKVYVDPNGPQQPSVVTQAPTTPVSAAPAGMSVVMPAPTQLAMSPQYAPIATQPMAQYSTGYMPQPGQQYGASILPTRRYYISESVDNYGYVSRIIHPGSYASVSQCNAALEDHLRQSEMNAMGLYQNQHNVFGYQQMALQMQLIQRKRTRISCVS